MIPILILSIENEDDREFMTQLYLQYHVLMYKIVLDIVHNSWDTEDILQEVLVKLIDKIPELRTMEKHSLINYVAVACKNTSYNFFRKKRPDILHIDDFDHFPSDEPPLEDIFATGDKLMDLANVWPTLDEKTKYLLNGKYILKKSAKELAADLNMPPDNVRMAIVRAKRKARKAMMQLNNMDSEFDNNRK